MKKRNILILFVISTVNLFSQTKILFKVNDIATKETLIGATIRVIGTKLGAITNSEGSATFNDLPKGSNIFQFSYIGYETLFDTIENNSNNPLEVEIFLKSTNLETDEVIVESNRSNRTVESIPTRVEILNEEIDEAASMEPSRISHLITHSTGVQVQTVSASANSGVLRIQGLNGKYSKILKDGFPLFGGFSGSLDIMQIPPLDLRQVEYIKGPSSTLHGGGAIAGVLNLISKNAKKDENLFHFNHSTIGTNDINFFQAKSIENLGFTNLVSLQVQNPYDADNDKFSDIPKSFKINLNPKIFYDYDKKNQFYFGLLFTKDDRKGGDLKLINNLEKDTNHFYMDEQNSIRIATQFKFESKLSDNQIFTFKHSTQIIH